MSVMIVTSLGDLVVDLFTDRCPMTCKNFLKLCKIKYYNGCLFHTVQKDFTAQTGDPTGTGSGGDSVYKFLYGDQARFFGDEIHLDVKHSKTGTVAMASAGEHLNASQFYVTLRDDLDYLDGKHTVFGEVAEGLDTLARINEAYVDEKSKPYKNIRIKHTYILDDPYADPPQLAELIPDASPEGKPKDEVDDDVRLEDDWVPMDEQLNPHELEEVLRAKSAHSSAVVLETIGDIPDAEVKPPDNVLFVCKLNPVTEDEDLHTIFSRFGVVTSAEVIRDHKTQDSLCYAFIEFEDTEACEQAYFKMDNALIDDRRIHVDFSQSVSKLWNQFRRKGQKGGCFKCGSVDHIAKDCTGDSTTKQHSKYTLRDDNTQRGGNRSTRYEMVFEGDAERSPEHAKRRRDQKGEKQDEKRNDKTDYHKSGDEDDRRRERHERRSPYRGRDRDHREKSYRKDDDDHKKRQTDDVGRKYRRDGKEFEKKPGDDNSHRYKREERNGDDTKKRSAKEDGVHSDGIVLKHKRDGREYEKRGDEAGHRYKRDERNADDTRKRSAKEYDGPRDDVPRKHKRDEWEYENKRGDEASHRYKRDEKNDDTQKRSIKDVDDRHKRRR